MNREPLSLEKLRTCLNRHPWAGLVQVMDTVDSTNDLAKALALRGAPEGTVLLADHQSAGRGRLGRSFLSEARQGIYLSVILRPRQQAQELMHLTCGAAVAACDALEQGTGIRPGIKWTNDLVYDGHKLAGILTELSLDGAGKVRYAVVGIGINCSQKPEDFPPELGQIAGSVTMMTGREPDRNLLAAELIQALYRLSRTLITERKMWMEAYRRDCVTVGRAVVVHDANGTRLGQAQGVDDWGGLLVDFGQGPETVQAGEVSVRGMYGYV